ncbi:cytochrome P450 [Multifurca ochricompacta]|uniref:Cytochrome P450 n=1 Tax=Multifurca ochricompacta TaxID=376703 RepID=A0AAD4QLD3_9AGAM|nr:cytochrome P450 [Multifurca ochricompacta]
MAFATGTIFVDLLVFLSLLVAVQAIHSRRRRGGLSYPPGPRPLPIIGNIRDIPQEFSWLAYTKLSKTYGPILSFHVFGQVIVVLNNLKSVKDLLEKRGDIYSDRTVVPFHEMAEWQWNMAFARYSEIWRLGRKILDRGLRPGPAAKYRPMQQTQARVLLNRMLTRPNEWEAHIELLQGEMILAMGYGYEVQGPDDRKIHAAQKLTKISREVTLPGALLVNNLPFLRHIPEWLPWFSYKPLARFAYDIGQEVINDPIDFVKRGILNGTAQPSLALDQLKELEKLTGTEHDKAEQAMLGALGTLYTAGAETTVAAIMTFLVAILLHPEIQKKAQDELDAVTGRERLPTFEDRPSLPFIEALCKETLRWKPVGPLAVPHATTKDDVYEGYFIPKGALVIGNTWAIFHDPEAYPEPDAFKPERYINPDGSARDDPTLSAAFGYGRRICPGRYFVDATLFIVIASLLSAFDIKRGPKGEEGVKGPSEYNYTGNLVSRPTQFPCSFIPRDKRAEELISDSLIMGA